MAGIPPDRKRILLSANYCESSCGASFAMRKRLLIRNWWGVAICGLLALTVPVWADTSPQTSTAQTSKKKPVHHLATHSSTSKAHVAGRASSAQGSTHQTKRTRSKGKTKSTKRGQKAIDAERAQQIQEALIREHYLEGEPSGNWDNSTQAAMRRYQADQGWQTKTIPDSRALIKLGLGPSPEHLLNPESAMTSSVSPVSAKTEVKPSADDPPSSPASDRSSGDPPRR